MRSHPSYRFHASPIRPKNALRRTAASPFSYRPGPGTGKTRTLVGRVLSLLAEGIDPLAILILTFSNRAAGELLGRLAAAAPEAAPRLWIGTFHAFGLDLVRRYYDKLELAQNPSLFDRSDAIEVLEDILPTLPIGPLPQPLGPGDGAPGHRRCDLSRKG